MLSGDSSSHTSSNRDAMSRVDCLLPEEQVAPAKRGWGSEFCLLYAGGSTPSCMSLAILDLLRGAQFRMVYHRGDEARPTFVAVAEHAFVEEAGRPCSSWELPSGARQGM